MRKFKVGIDSYSLKPLDLDPFELLDWATINEAEGVQFSETPAQAGDKSFLRELSQYAAQNDLYLEWGGGEHIPFDIATGQAKNIAGINEKAAEQASLMGVRTIRSCSGGLMRWKKGAPPTETYLKEMAKSLRPLRRMLKDHRAILALETHFEFTTFELIRLFEMCDAEPDDYLGVCLDTMNLLTMLEDPVAATRRILPWVVTTHIKDGAINLTPGGLVSFTAEAGKGLIDFKKILTLLSGLERHVNLTIEDHGGEFLIPIFDPAFLDEFPDLSVKELSVLLKMAAETRSLIDENEIAVLDRTRWPAACEDRVKRDLKAVKRMAGT
ncbi:MAG: TIM barrel protein [Candidatus Aminicenantales bacterium]